MRLAAGRARDLGLPTRGTTAPGRLKRVDRWLLHCLGQPRTGFVRTAEPLVVDLGYGSSTITTVELACALRRLRAEVRVVGVENDRARVGSALLETVPAGVTFVYGGFDVASLRPFAIRAMNVLRQYEESAVPAAWAQLRTALSPGGIVVEGTCDELGRRGSWVTLDAAGPTTLTLSAHLATLERPSDIAPRLPKALIHRNVPGEPVHAFLTAADDAWTRAAPQATFGPRQRWADMCARLRAAGWPVLDGPRRWRLGELSVPWSAVAPAEGRVSE